MQESWALNLLCLTVNISQSIHELNGDPLHYQSCHDLVPQQGGV